MKKTAQYRQQIQSKRAQVSAMQFNKKSIVVYVAMIIASNGAEANPIGGEFAQGMGSISNAVGLTTIQQTTQQAIVNWQSFGSNAGEVIKFVQPNANAAILNRVVGNLPSNLNGLLEGNGRVYLVNPNGIVLGANGVINVNGGFVASTQGISDSAFMQGGALLFSGENTGSMQILGKIQSAQGDIVIIAPKTEIAAGATLQAGQNIQLIAANEVQLSNGKFTVTPKLSDAGQLTVAGTLEAAKVQLEAHNNNLGALAINTTGTIRATGTQTNPDGSVSIMAYGDGSNIKVSGNISAQNNDPSKQGGRIIVGRNEGTGELAKSADVSGAIFTTSKGFVETSGDWLATTGTRVLANEWLLDPTDITITSGTSSNTNWHGATQSGSTISASDISYNLNQGTNVTIQSDSVNSGAGNITVNAAITKSQGNDASLTLHAANNITLNQAVTSSTSGGKLNVTLSAGNTTTTGKVDINAAITSNGGNIKVETKGSGAITQVGSVSAGAGNVSYQTAAGSGQSDSGQILLRGTSTLSGNNISLDNTGGNIDSTTGVITAGSAKSASTGIYVYQANINATGNLYLTGSGERFVNGFGNSGVQLNPSANGQYAKVSAANIYVEGKSDSGVGVLVYNGALLQASSGNVTIKGSTTHGDDGISVLDFGRVLASADITLDAGNKNLNLENFDTGNVNNVTVSGSITGANVNLIADQMNILAPVKAVNGGTVTLKNSTAGVQVDLGGFDVSGTLGIENAELNNIIAASTVIGSTSNTGDISVSTATTTASATGDIILQTGGNIAVNAALSAASGKNLTLKAIGNINVNDTISQDGVGNILLAAGFGKVAGDGSGGQVKRTSLGAVSNTLGKTYIYTGTVADSAKMRDLNSAFDPLTLGTNAQLNTATDLANTISGSAANMQVMYRENIVPGVYVTNPLSNEAVLLTPITFGFGVVGGATAAGGEVEGSCDAWSQRAGAGSISVVSLLKPSYMGLRTAKTDTMDAMAGAQITGSTLDADDNPCASAALVNRQASL